ncbi:DUF309 domain-containing protein [Chengkuizengella axinellae]|uniref:DUF309 domain-containing protein n=1 Tax=Chengkuizengella axinellae TaxID=3064388 RepID=A0ABT9IX58_9BACL|nr:DUF309 domain-containing protein [Chengkuizengella sp. 2205SS18-9]MDP5273955.1 DUF309 domain-containing protein [Chengkuizengella sp. 2205SS18-9]
MNHTTQYPEEYIKYLVYFHGERDYFECHEILEEYWKEKEKPELDAAWVGLIQVAVSLYHQRRNNVKGAIKMMRSAISNLTEIDLQMLGINAKVFLEQLRSRLTNLISNEALVYEDMNIPLKDVHLIKKCKQLCKDNNLSWQSHSNINDEALIHKHTLRDRSEVIKSRELAKTEKNKK